MKKILVISLVSLLTIGLVGCDKRDDKNVVMYIEEYLNTSESVKINGYNGYKLIDSDIVENEDGSYSISIKMDKPIK